MSFREIILSNCADVASVQKAITDYFRDDVSGSKFEIVADTDNPNEFTARDIVAVSMLSVNVPPMISFWLLHGEGKHQNK